MRRQNPKLVPINNTSAPHRYEIDQICVWRRPNDTRIVRLGKPRKFMGSWVYEIKGIELTLQHNRNYDTIDVLVADERELAELDLVEWGMFRQKLDSLLKEEAERLSK